MRKLTMQIDALEVETIDVAPDREDGRGTVRARQWNTWYCTANDDWPCNEETNWALNANCVDSMGGANCTNVCPSGPYVCDTAEHCG